MLGCAIAVGLAGRGTVDRGPVAAPGLEAEIAELPLSFEPRGGADGEYLARSVAGGTLALAGGDAALALPGAGGRIDTLTLGLARSSNDPEPSVSAPAPGRVNRFIGDDPQRWSTGIPTYEQVSFAEVYPGIDIDYYGNQRELEYDFRLAPGANPDRIAVELGGADSVRIDSDGGLAIEVGSHRVRQLPPVAYQTLEGERIEVPARFVLDGATVGFAVGGYDLSQPLVIDPVVLGFSTLAGGNPGSDILEDLAVDPSGDVFIGGGAASAFAPIADGFQTYGGSFSDAVVMKLDVAADGGVSLAYSTYLGGSGVEEVRGIAADAAGAAYVTGETQSTNFPTQDPYQGDQPAGDAFVTKLNPDSGGAVTLAYSTYLGGSSSDTGHSIAVDPAGAAYVGSSTGSTNFPTEDPIPLMGDPQGFDGAITKLAPDSGGAVALAYSTYLGGNDADGVNGIAVTPDGAAYVTGVAFGNNFPTKDPFQFDQPGIDGFVAKLDPEDFADLDWSTYLGGGGNDSPEAIALDAAGAAYVFGDTDSTDFPTVRAFLGDQGGSDVFVTRVDPGPTPAIGYSTYLGGTSFDGTPEDSEGIAVDEAGGVYVTGFTGSADYPLADPFDPSLSGTIDAFATRIAPDDGGPLQLSLSTYFGGAAADQGYAIETSGADFWLLGETDSADMPLVDPLPGPTTASSDAFISRFQPAQVKPPAAPDTTPPQTTIVKRPKRKTKKRKARFVFESSESGSSFECKLDKKPFSPCAASAKFTVKRKPKRHKLAVRAIDAAANADPSPAVAKWRLKRRRR